MGSNMEKEHIHMLIKIAIQDGGNLERNREPGLIHIMKQELSLLENGKTISSLRGDGYSQMELTMKDHLAIINQMEKEFGIL